MTKVEIQLDEELTRFTAYLKDEMKDAIIRSAMKEIIEDQEQMTSFGLEEDRRYYRKLCLAAKRILKHYTV